MSDRGLRKGWCPSVSAPMPAGDGLLMRLRLAAGQLPGALAQGIALLASEFGNGTLDLTQRANLQVRGISPASLPKLRERLAALPLFTASACPDTVPNVTVSPLAGLDPACADGRALARAIEAVAPTSPPLYRLPPKFGFAIDGGGVWPLGDAGADISLVATDAGGVWRMRLAGSRCLSEVLETDRAVAAMVRVAEMFADSGAARLRDLVAISGSAGIFGLAGLGIGRDLGPEQWQRPMPGAYGLAPGAAIAAIGLPFGHLDAAQLAALAAAAGHGSVLRLTPWRLLLVPAASVAAAHGILAYAAELGLAVSPRDPRLAIEACTGAPGCANGTTFTRRDATRLLALIQPNADGRPRVHVSGCEKGCAHRGTAPVTLVARRGRYDLVCNGGVAQSPTRRDVAPEDLPAVVSQAM